MALQIKHWIKFSLGPNTYAVRLGDVVWFYPACNMEATPLCGVITEISEDMMVKLNILSTDVVKRPPMEAVCLYGTDRLLTPVQRNKGCWLPRTEIEDILNSPKYEG